MMINDTENSVKDMLGRSGVIPLDDALKLLEERLALCSKRAIEDVSLEQCLGRILGKDICSKEDIPP
jgi:molybdopterin biosynthesis enzyme